LKISAKDIKFSEAIELLVEIENKKMIFSDLKNMATDGAIFMLREQLEWIETGRDDDIVAITENGSRFILEHDAMVVLRNIKNRLIAQNVTDQAIDYLEEKEYIYYLKTKDEGYVGLTEKGTKAISQYFDEE